MELVIASKNLHKIREIRAILKPQFSFDYLSLLDFPSYTLPEESGASFEENASIKGLHAAKSLNRWVIADDSGLVIPALNNTPGFQSARYSGANATDQENRKKLIQALDALEEGERTGYYVCALALASPNGMHTQALGLCEGSLILIPRGGQGFGYDPLFLKYDYNKTFGEMDEEVKNKISHRRKALDKLASALQTLLTSKEM